MSNERTNDNADTPSVGCNADYVVTVENSIPPHFMEERFFERSLNVQQVPVKASSRFVAKGMAMAKMRIDFYAVNLAETTTRIVSVEKTT